MPLPEVVLLRSGHTTAWPQVGPPLAMLPCLSHVPSLGSYASGTQLQADRPRLVQREVVASR